MGGTQFARESHGCATEALWQCNGSGIGDVRGSLPGVHSRLWTRAVWHMVIHFFWCLVPSCFSAVTLGRTRDTSGQNCRCGPICCKHVLLWLSSPMQLWWMAVILAQAAALEQTHETTKQAEQHYQVCNWDQHFSPQLKKITFPNQNAAMQRKNQAQPRSEWSPRWNFMSLCEVVGVKVCGEPVSRRVGPQSSSSAIIWAVFPEAGRAHRNSSGSNRPSGKEGYFFFRGRFWIFFGSWFYAFPVSLIFCFSASLLFCFSAFCFPCSFLLLLLLFYFFFSSIMCFCCSTSCSFASLLPVFTVSLFFIFFCFVLFVS